MISKKAESTSQQRIDVQLQTEVPMVVMRKESNDNAANEESAIKKEAVDNKKGTTKPAVPARLGDGIRVFKVKSTH